MHPLTQKRDRAAHEYVDHPHRNTEIEHLLPEWWKIHIIVRGSDDQEHAYDVFSLGKGESNTCCENAVHGSHSFSEARLTSEQQFLGLDYPF